MSADILPIATPRQTRKAMWRLLAQRPGKLTLTIFVLLAASCCGLAAPAILGLMVNIAATGGDVMSLLWLAIGLLLAGGLGALLGVLGQNLLARICEEALAGLREEVFAAAVRKPLNQLEKAGIGDVVARVSGDVEAVSEAISGVLPAFTSAAFTIGVTLLGLGVIDWRFAVAVLIAAPLQIFTLRWFLKRTAPIYRTVRITEANRTEQIIETVHGSPSVLALGLGSRHADLVAAASRENIGHSLRGVGYLTRFYNRLNLAELIGLSAVLLVGFWLHSEGAVTIGAATAAALYFYRLFDPIGLVLGQFDELQKAAAGLGRMFGLTMYAEPAAASKASSAAGEAGIVLDHVTFAYPGQRPALRGVSLTVRPAERVAIVGTSGAGKTTLAKVIMGLEHPGSGTAWVGGLDSASAAPADLHSRIAMVSQEVHVFSGTLAEDLRLAKPDASAEQLSNALQAVGADWVAALDDGLDTSVGAGGHQLTPEQAQQLALARLMLKDPPIAVLDEATAEAGTGSATMLDQAAEAALAGRTSVVIAHRLSQATSADTVVVMEQGRIVESGSHQELLAAEGRYAHLWEAWNSSLSRS
ncbi:ABC transporter ATP-binding protein [Paenarthrobacter aurescens]|uniref:Multidrug ABC transporter permease n=1 Tax=Paenarthrobacter aurescens TaxID=43663 RepID=A0A4Y3NIJ8_PAEAU|nr:ABC transporter ATP-binding protein [Paenarthrobacter aurescens]UKA50337.1 ABC transporter ATP-binding protein/permease [Arthrobacter sp. FW305-123]MDO6142075.1 ABC transporter ATP-binding protein/permease [Paenarthrobacter aurescens]MDO6145878.1 ABC transporter ATP-binding protein/permease [Paenarthrobacter aurescens]MDO6157124.1 ABC transporter ATP-binding protein/permease [Paenarthrobacter aurescens]MDO6161110.1 ABC transporter ATP-binding protein/permease [Paenarthrobacter aurescens]